MTILNRKHLEQNIFEQDKSDKKNCFGQENMKSETKNGNLKKDHSEPEKYKHDDSGKGNSEREHL